MELKDALYIGGIIVSAIISFLGTRHKLKDYFKDEIHSLELQLKDLNFKDDLQQQVIDQIGKQMDVLVPKLIDALNERKIEPKKLKNEQ
jgi:hypothetical protein